MNEEQIKRCLEAFRKLLAACEQMTNESSNREWSEFQEAIDTAHETLVYLSQR